MDTKRTLCCFPLLCCVFALVMVGPGPAEALLTGGQDIIPAPAFIIDDPPGATNDHQQAFNERQNVLLPGPVTTDSGVIPAGTRVSSHMIFLNTDGAVSGSDRGVIWTFDGPVIGVMSDGMGTLETASNAVLGAPGTVYPGSYPARGMEGGDSYVVAGNQITVNMGVSEPGDWIRVVTSVREVAFDIHPTSCPNPLSVNKKGVIPTAIIGTMDFDVATIDPASILLEGVPPKRWNMSDVATPFEGDLCDCTTEGPDGMTDLTLKFSAPEILEAIGPVMSGDEVVLTLTGTLRDGSPFIARDCMVIRGPHRGIDDQPVPAPDLGGSRPGLTVEDDETTRPLTWGTLKSRY